MDNMIKLKQLLIERQYTSSNWISTLLNSVKDVLVGSNLSNIEIEKILNKKFQSKNIYFERFDDPDGAFIRDNWASVGISCGWINTDGSVGVGYIDKFWETFEDGERWEDFVKVISAILVHELTHRDQFIKMMNNSGFFDSASDLQDSKYLAHPKEIQAFAREAVEEYIQLGYSIGDILQLLRTAAGGNVKQAHKEESDAFWYYYDYFQDKQYGDQKVWRKFLKYMYEYLQQAEK